MNQESVTQYCRSSSLYKSTCPSSFRAISSPARVNAIELCYCPSLREMELKMRFKMHIVESRNDGSDQTVSGHIIFWVFSSLAQRFEYFIFSEFLKCPDTFFCADLSHLHLVLRILFSVNFLRYGFCAARYIIFSLPVGFIREKHLYMYGVLLRC